MAPFDFDVLRDMHNSANELLHSPMIQRALFHEGDEKLVTEVSEASLRMLDVCGISKDVLLLVKQHLQDLQFTLRRAAIGDAGVTDKIMAYNCYRKKLKKETMECLKCLKRMKSRKANNTKWDLLRLKEQNLMLVVDVLREVRVTSISIVESLLSLISTPWLDTKKYSGKRSFASKLVPLNMQNNVDDEYDMVVLRSANKRLEGVRLAIEDLESELECMFRRLIHTRVLLLNVLTN